MLNLIYRYSTGISFEKDAIYKKLYWTWEYPRTPHKIEKSNVLHRHLLKLADIRAAALDANNTNETDLLSVLDNSQLYKKGNLND